MNREELDYIIQEGEKLLILRNAPGNATQETILRLIREDPSITQKEMASRIGLTPDGVKFHMNRLKEIGLIRHEGPTKKGQWVIISQAGETS